MLLDFALSAIEMLLSGDRKWNREVDPTVEEHLKGTIDSDVNHLANSYDNRFGKLPPEAEEGQEPFMLQIKGREASPEQVVIDRDWQERFQKAVMKEIGADEFLMQLFYCLQSDVTKPSEIAEILDMEVEEINNGKKKLRRRLEKVERQFAPKLKTVKS